MPYRGVRRRIHHWIVVLAYLFTAAPVLAQHPQVVNSLLGVYSLGFDSAGNALVPARTGLQRMRPDGTVISQWPLLSGANQVALDGGDNLYVFLGSCESGCPAPTTTFGTGSRGVLFGKVDATGAFVWLDRLSDVPYGAIMKVDTAGNVYLTGTADCSFSTTPGSFQPQCAPNDTAPSFAAKVDSTGANLLYATFLRGTTQNSQNVISMAIDASGSVYVIGRSSSDWPTTPGAFETGCPFSGMMCNFVAKLSADGSSLEYSTFLNEGIPSSIAVDSQGSAYVAGQTANMNFPTTPGSAEPTFSTWTPQSGNPYPAFLVKFRPDGTSLVYSTYVSLLDQTSFEPGGAQHPFRPVVSLDSAGDAYVCGLTRRPGVQTVNAIQADDNHPNAGEGAIAELNSQGLGYVFSTYLGGTGALDTAPGEAGYLNVYPVALVAVAGDGLIHISGLSVGNDFPALASFGQYEYISVGYIMALQPSGTDAVPIMFYASPFWLGSFIGALEAALPNACAGPSCFNVPPTSQVPVYLGNYGAAPLAISSIATTGEFTQTNDCPASLAAGARCIITVTFRPTAIGTRNGMLTLNGVGVTQSLALFGVGVAAEMQSSASTLYFGVQPVGTTSPAQTITITNTGTAALEFSSITVQGQFSQMNTCGSVGLGQCTIQVVFAPTASGPQHGTLTLTSNAINGPMVIQLEGGVNADFVIAGGSTSQTVTAGQTATYNLTLTPVAGFSGTVSLSCAGAPTSATCAVSPSSVNLSGNSAVGISVSVSTTARSMVGGPRLDTPGGSPLGRPGWLSLWAMSVFVAALWFVSRKRRFSMAIGLLGAVALFATLAIVSCGGGSSRSMGSGTPAGTYTITVNVSSGSTAHSQNLTLTVQ